MSMSSSPPHVVQILFKKCMEVLQGQITCRSRSLGSHHRREKFNCPIVALFKFSLSWSYCSIIWLFLELVLFTTEASVFFALFPTTFGWEPVALFWDFCWLFSLIDIFLFASLRFLFDWGAFRAPCCLTFLLICLSVFCCLLFAL